LLYVGHRPDKDRTAEGLIDTYPRLNYFAFALLGHAKDFSRLAAGQDLHATLEAVLFKHDASAAFVIRALAA
jgi:hypothetical protein